MYYSNYLTNVVCPIESPSSNLVKKNVQTFIYMCICVYTYTHTYTHTPHPEKLIQNTRTSRERKNKDNIYKCSILCML